MLNEYNRRNQCRHITLQFQGWRPVTATQQRCRDGSIADAKQVAETGFESIETSHRQCIEQACQRAAERNRRGADPGAYLRPPANPAVEHSRIRVAALRHCYDGESAELLDRHGVKLQAWRGAGVRCLVPTTHTNLLDYNSDSHPHFYFTSCDTVAPLWVLAFCSKPEDASQNV